MKITAISDTHNQINRLPDNLSGDVLLHAGDHTGSGSVFQWTEAMIGLAYLGRNFKKIITVPGNHDWICETYPGLAKTIAEEHNITLLNHEPLEYEGVSFFGSGYTPAFCNWALNCTKEQLELLWEQIPDNTQVLVSHGPPKYILDAIPHFDKIEHAGDVALGNKIDKLLQLKISCFGHIHEGYGTHEHNGVTFINASSCDEAYRPINKPIEVTI